MRVKTQQFGCVRMKNDIQARMRRRYAGWTDKERQTDMERRLAESDSPVGRLWRDLTGKHPVSKVAELPAKYQVKPNRSPPMSTNQRRLSSRQDAETPKFSLRFCGGAWYKNQPTNEELNQNN